MSPIVLPLLPPRFTHEQAPDWVQRCHSQLRGHKAWSPGQPCAVPAGALEVFDSAALAALLAVTRLVQNAGGRLQLLDMPPRLRELATLYGVSAWLPD
jgi:phospholipid transport system transporter-binding protein